MKDTPKRAGEIIDAICRHSGIDERRIPGAVTLHRSEATTILAYIQELQKMVKGGTDGKPA